MDGLPGFHRGSNEPTVTPYPSRRRMRGLWWERNHRRYPNSLPRNSLFLGDSLLVTLRRCDQLYFHECCTVILDNYGKQLLGNFCRAYVGNEERNLQV